MCVCIYTYVYTLVWVRFEYRRPCLYIHLCTQGITMYLSVRTHPNGTFKYTKFPKKKQTSPIKFKRILIKEKRERERIEKKIPKGASDHGDAVASGTNICVLLAQHNFYFNVVVVLFFFVCESPQPQSHFLLHHTPSGKIYAFIHWLLRATACPNFSSFFSFSVKSNISLASSQQHKIKM